MLTVICVKFGDRYNREYVEKLRNMVNRHLSIPYEFVCLTDDKQPFDNIKSIHLPNLNYPNGWWYKVHLFDPALPISGPVLYFDLDIVIHDSIDKLIPKENEFKGIRDFNRKFNPKLNSLNSSVMGWIHGQQSDIWTAFISSRSDAFKLHGDQDWIWKLANKRITFWFDEWIRSYKWEIRERSEIVISTGKRNFASARDDITISPDCCLTVFHGEPKPNEVNDPYVLLNWR